jgi:hypothetical protein
MISLHNGSSWTRGRFFALAGVLFALQAGLILLFGDHSRPTPPAFARTTRFHALGASVGEQQLLQLFFVGDPAVFPLPNPHGFSGRAWLDQRPPAYQSEIQLEAPSWLPLDTARLGTNFLAPQPGSATIPSDLAEQQTLHVEPLPDFLGPEIVLTQSVFRLEGELEGSLSGGPPQLRVWTNLLSNSVVQIAVDQSGSVLAARLAARCGWAEADADAVAKARALRFAPSPTARTRWGRAVFQWRTAEPDAAAAAPNKAP